MDQPYWMGDQRGEEAKGDNRRYRFGLGFKRRDGVVSRGCMFRALV